MQLLFPISALKRDYVSCTVTIVFLLNVQFGNRNKVSQKVNGPFEAVIRQISACNRRVVRVETDGVPSRQKVRFLLVHSFRYYSYRCKWRAKEITRTVKELMQLLLLISALKRDYVSCTVIIVFSLKRTVW